MKGCLIKVKMLRKENSDAWTGGKYLGSLESLRAQRCEHQHGLSVYFVIRII